MNYYFDTSALIKSYIEDLAKDFIHQFQLKTLDGVQLASCVSVVADIQSFVLCDGKLLSCAKS
ncbi:MAG: hypothetical protein IPO06_04350 [Leptospiraceae bacterium]|nr:hypothetical protein [Leptospiraceae bacterium]